MAKTEKNVLGYLQELKRTGEQRRRLTKQLQELISDLLDEIAEQVPKGTAVPFEDGKLVCSVLKSNVGSWRTITFDYEDYGYYTFNSRIDPGAQYYLHGDFRAGHRNAPRELWLKIANNLPEIIEAFNAENQKIIEALRESFAKLRQMAEAETIPQG